jgi:hypothetical protein
MPRLNLIERAIPKLPAPDPSGQQVYHWDTSMRGFGVAGRTDCFGGPRIINMGNAAGRFAGIGFMAYRRRSQAALMVA